MTAFLWTLAVASVLSVAGLALNNTVITTLAAIALVVAVAQLALLALRAVES
jgi:hypothetical protein